MDAEHGGAWAAYKDRYGREPLDFSANLCPLGLPRGVREAAASAILEAEHYPDSACTKLQEALAREYDIPAERIVCGTGAAELIWRLCQSLRPKTALLPVPSFSEYERALQAAGCDILYFPLDPERDFAPGEELLTVLEERVDMLFLCQPNNPTGRAIQPALLRRIWERCEAQGTWLILDECFLDFLDEPENNTLLPELENAPHLILLRAFTKSHAMAGFRLGYALCGSAALAEELRHGAQPWPVSAVAQAAGLAALADRDYAARRANWIRAERPRMLAALKSLGFRVIPGEGNFLLFYSNDLDLVEALKEKGILLRSCGNFRGLGPGWYRTAIRTAEENDALLRALKERHNG